MKRATLEATDENILQSIKKECGTRNAEIKDFIEALENDKSYRKTVDMPFSDNELKIYNFDTN